MDDLGNSARRTDLTSAFAPDVNQRLLCVLYDTPVRPVATIYADNFDGAGGLHGSAPDQRPGSETWTASADWLAVGTTASVNSTSEDDSAFLPFTPLPGKIYTLSATLQQPTGGYSTSSTNAWVGIGLRSLRKQEFTTNPAISHLGLAREDGVAADLDAFSLTAENGDVAPRIVAFSAVGGNVWELELAADPGMPFEFRSSPELVFVPGDPVDNLSQGTPDDPGIISGPNDSVVTTDANGSAKLRMTLPGHPRDFVRAVALP